jgi:hypothetical protein
MLIELGATKYIRTLGLTHEVQQDYFSISLHHIT